MLHPDFEMLGYREGGRLSEKLRVLQQVEQLFQKDRCDKKTVPPNILLLRNSWNGPQSKR